MDRNLLDRLPPAEANASEDEAATAKVWAIYAREAEKYDKGLVESWKSDMEGMLIFAGLFSAVLTAFLIESYKTLNPDPGDLTVQLLTRISEQIVASANGNTSKVPLPLELNDSGPTRAALACNALWFLSLGLSLSCALIATLLEQWAREFLHRTDIHSAPVIRARIFSFLYYGLRRFNMHAIVDIIPLLLHLSLMLFFSGLVAFLIPVNTGIAIIAAVMLFVVATTYSVLTVFPLRYLDSPYRTPLTGLFWKLFHYFKIRCNRHRVPSADEATHPEIAGETIVAAISRVAAEPSEQRVSRDLKALVWTMKSLADDMELEPFVDAISDILWSPHGWRKAHYDLLRHLVNDSQTLLHTRIIELYRSCNAGILTPAALKRRKIICYKAFCTTIPLLHSPDFSAIFLEKYRQEIDLHWFREKPHREKDLEVLQYATSAKGMLRWRVFEIDKILLTQHFEYLRSLRATSGDVDTIATLRMADIQRFIEELPHHNSEYIFMLPLNFDYGTSSDRILGLMEHIRHILTAIPHVLFFNYLRSASMLDAMPYFFDSALKLIRPPHCIPPSIRSLLDAAFDEVVPRILSQFNSAKPDWMEFIMDELITSWLQQGSSDGITLHPEFLRYLNSRRSVFIPMYVATYTGSRFFWEVLANTLETTTERTLLRDSLTAAWRLSSMQLNPPFSLTPRLLDAYMRLDIPSISPSLIAVCKSLYIPGYIRRDIFPTFSATDRYRTNAMHEWLKKIAMPVVDRRASSSTVAYEFSSDHAVVEDGDAFVVLYAEYLQLCAATTEVSGLPHEAMETLKLMDAGRIDSPQIQARHQLQFATALRSFFESSTCKHLRFTIIADTWLFRRYLDPDSSYFPQWLDNSTARDSAIATLTQYVEEMEGSTEAGSEEVGNSAA
ncbi:hypothetical protein R3P38DRAFT_286745 [Favolaschia claudopus]|uniref:DUF6535 domain-containing protein n=1 Tax=Favolaschia claudopus TaxID=2862362 RepID=A0AAV9ZNX3_9AGAR